MALNKLHKKDFAIAVKTGGNALDEQKFAKQASKGELFFNSNDNKLYIATTDAGLTDATLKQVQLSDYAAPFGNTHSVDFGGTNEYAAVTTATDNIYSLSMWFKPDSSISSSSAPQILLGTVASSHYIALGSISSDFTNEVITVYRGAGGFAYTSNTATISTSWNHLFVSWLSSSTTNSGSAGYDIWLNGTQVGNTAAGSIPTAPNYWGSSSKIGTRSNLFYYFDGKIDEVATWTSNVSADVANIYNSGNGAVDLNDTGVVSTGPTHWWRMGDNDGATGTTITDQGSAAADATLTNGPTFSPDAP